MGTFTRRTLLVGSAAVLGAAACGSDGDAVDDAAGSPAEPSDAAAYSLVGMFPASGSNYLPAGTPRRLPFVIAGPDGAPLDVIEGPVTVRLSKDGAAVGEAVVVEPRNEGIQRAYLPVPLTFPSEGVYTVTATYQGVDMDATLEASPEGSSTIPDVGQQLPPVATPTTDDPRGVTPICTNDPQCGLHTTNLQDALGDTTRPTMLLISTPAYCQTAICGPVLQLAVAAAAEHPGIDSIHAEVYADPESVDRPEQSDLAPVVAEYGLPIEPVLYLADADGVITHRFDSIFDASELAEALATLSG